MRSLRMLQSSCTRPVAVKFSGEWSACDGPCGSGRVRFHAGATQSCNVASTFVTRDPTMQATRRTGRPLTARARATVVGRIP